MQVFESFGLPYLGLRPDLRAGSASPAAAAILEANRDNDLWGRLVSEISRSKPVWPPVATTLALGTYTASVQSFGHAGAEVHLAVLQRSHGPQPAATRCLTRRETEIARLIAAGESAKRIAYLLAISEHTVRHHTEHIFEKLGARSRAAVAAMMTSWSNDNG